MVDLDDETSQDDVRSGSESPVADEATLAAAAAIERELSSGGADTHDAFEQAKQSKPAMRSSSTPCIDIDEDDSNSETQQPLKPQWIIDTQFKKEQQRLNMSEDPRDWLVISLIVIICNCIPLKHIFIQQVPTTSEALAAMGCSTI